MQDEKFYSLKVMYSKCTCGTTLLLLAADRAMAVTRKHFIDKKCHYACFCFFLNWILKLQKMPFYLAYPA